MTTFPLECVTRLILLTSFLLSNHPCILRPYVVLEQFSVYALRFDKVIFYFGVISFNYLQLGLVCIGFSWNLTSLGFGTRFIKLFVQLLFNNDNIQHFFLCLIFS